MSTLAQMIVNTPEQYYDPNSTVADKITARKMYETVRSMLMPIEITRPENPDLIPAKFVFNIDAPAIVYDLLENKTVTYDALCSMLLPPAPRTWIEWKLPISFQENSGFDPIERMGCLCYTPNESDKFFTNYFFGLSARRHVPVTMYKVLTSSETESRSTWNNPGVTGGSYKRAIQDFCCTLFLVNVPRACEINEIRHDAKLQKCRQKNGKLPLIEYKQMILRVGVGTTRSAPHPSAGVTSDHPDTRRLHEVVGHFRTLKKDREKPVLSYVPHHWRGDPEKGIVLHERHVTT